MSKITQALEKASRERAQRSQEQATVSGGPVTIPLAGQTADAIAPAGQIHIDPHIVTAIDVTSPIAEQYRLLKANVQSLRLRSGPKVIAVTSAVHGEGKSVTSINLALTLARQEQLKVLLIDGDLRKSSVHHWLGLQDRAHGLSTALANGGALNGSLVRLQSPPLAVLPAGPRSEHPAELLESSSMKRLLANLKGQFDLILIDTPPVLVVADSGLLSALADGVLFVVRTGKTQCKTILQAQRLLEQMKATVLGCVLTHAEYYVPGYYRYYREQQEQQQEKPRDATAIPAASVDLEAARSTG